MNTAQDDVAAAIASLSEGADGAKAPAPPPDDASQSSPPAPPSGGPGTDSRPDSAPAIARGPDGRFAPSSDTVAPAPAPLGSEAPKEPAPKNAAPKDPAPGDESSVKLDPSKPPQGWRPEAREKWSTLPEDIRREVIRREEASAAGVAKLRQQYAPMETLFKQIEPHAKYFQHIKRDPGEYINDVIKMEQSLSLGNPAQKFETLLAVADTYGVPIRQALDSAMKGGLNSFLQQAHQQHRTPPAIPPEVQRELQEARQFREKILADAATAEYNAFIADEENHPFFEEVKDSMAKLLETGAAETFKEAYELAVYRDPAIRQREIARQNGLAQKQSLANRQAAAASVATPGSTPPLQNGVVDMNNMSTEDAVRAAMAKLQG